MHIFLFTFLSRSDRWQQPLLPALSCVWGWLSPLPVRWAVYGHQAKMPLPLAQNEPREWERGRAGDAGGHKVLALKGRQSQGHLTVVGLLEIMGGRRFLRSFSKLEIHMLKLPWKLENASFTQKPDWSMWGMVVIR